MKVFRTYPQPDSPNENIRARERALAVFKYLLDMEPELARVHPKYALIKAAFEQEGIMATRRWFDEAGIAGAGSVGTEQLPQPRPSIADLIQTSQEMNFTPAPEPFTPDGL